MQYNLGRGRAATYECLRDATAKGVQVLLLQEPYVGNKAYMTVSDGCRIVQKGSRDVNKPVRSAIVFTDPALKFSDNSKFITEDIVGVVLNINSLKIGILCIYFDKLLDLGDYLIKVKSIVTSMNVDRILLGGDLNARSHWWGCDLEDVRGHAVSETLAELGLEVLNQGSKPTYHAHRSGQACTSIIDVTACSGVLLPKIMNWRVDEHFCTLSDHRPILFSMQVGSNRSTGGDRTGTRIYCTDKAEWSVFEEELQRGFDAIGLDVDHVVSVRDGDAVNIITAQYTDCVTRACEKAIPMLPAKKMSKCCKWWTLELTQLKAEVSRCRRKISKANQARKQSVVDQYLQAKLTYKKAIESAITESWKTFCTGEKKETVWQRSYRVMKACSAQVQDRLLEMPDGTTLTELESATLLADTFFPLDDHRLDTPEQESLRVRIGRLVEANKADISVADRVDAFTLWELEDVLFSMSSKKAPGGDGLTLEICKRAYKCNKNLLLELYSQCLRFGCFPSIWKVATIKVIPKPAKEDYAKPKSYRPIGLLPVLGKVLEKLFVNRLQWQLGKEQKLSPYQYGFTPQKSTEDALYDVMTVIRGHVRDKRIVVVVSLDIEGAFDNAWWPAIVDQLHKKEIDPGILRLVSDYLSERKIRLRYAGETVVKDTNKGCIQGSTCGPILWNVQLDPLLEQSQYSGVLVQAFADDIVMIAASADGHELERVMNGALAVMAQWGIRLRLKFAPSKTQTLLITKKLRYHTPILEMEGVQLTYCGGLKILGLTIDPMLNFRQHLDLASRKAIIFYKVVSRAARAQWGLNSEILRLIYSTVVEPTMLYAGSCWDDVSERVYAVTALNRLTRSFAIKISKAHRTVSLISSLLLARVLPLTLRVREHATIYRIKRGEPLTCLPGRILEVRKSCFLLPHPAKRERLTFKFIGSQEDVESLGNGPILFTDGSKLEGKVGAAVSLWTGGRELRYSSFRLENYCSVFQAELAAILRALMLIRDREELEFIIASDSRSGLELICDANSVHPLAFDIRECLTQLCIDGKKVQLCWVKAHVGIAGNERADELAKRAALFNRERPGYDLFPLSFAKKSIRAASIEAWQDTYINATTGGTTRIFFKEVSKAYKILDKILIDNYLAQILTGHGGFRSYLYRFKLADSPFCVCGDGVFQTVQHILAECPRFGQLRYDCENKMDKRISIDNFAVLMVDTNCRQVFLDFARILLRKVGKENGSIVD